MLQFYSTQPLFCSKLIHAYRLAIIFAIFSVSLHALNAHAQDATDTPEQASSPSPEKQHMEALAKTSTQNRLIWLGDNEKAFIAQYRSAITPFQIGVLGLSSDSANFSNTNILQSLQQELPLQGWSSLNALMPSKIKQSIPKRVMGINTAKTESDGASQDTPDTSGTNEAEKTDTGKNEHEQEAINRVVTATQHMLEQGLRSIALLTDNYNVERAILASIEQKDSVSGLILWRVDSKNLDLEKLQQLKESRATILDIVSSNEAKQALLERKYLFSQAGFEKDYTVITNTKGHEGDIISTRRIRHWLTTEFKKF